MATPHKEGKGSGLYYFAYLTIFQPNNDIFSID